MPYTRTVSDETRRKIAASNTGKVRSAETKAAISASKQGQKHSEETKQKIAASISQLWSKVPKQEDDNKKDNSKPLGF